MKLTVFAVLMISAGFAGAVSGRITDQLTARAIAEESSALEERKTEGCLRNIEPSSGDYNGCVSFSSEPAIQVFLYCIKYQVFDGMFSETIKKNFYIYINCSLSRRMRRSLNLITYDFCTARMEIFRSFKNSVIGTICSVAAAEAGISCFMENGFPDSASVLKAGVMGRTGLFLGHQDQKEEGNRVYARTGYSHVIHNLT
ncbi:hypothetical protein CSA37_08675 [Candidatus Fermentibacteria bacterium]|nr:MAG: hypothetical protein CSA37_08675 [Candidatus Fermentibacteria bacterium]